MAIQSIYRDMEYAKSLIKRKAGKHVQGAETTADDGDEEDEVEEAWTFVGGDEPDPEAMTKKLSEVVGLTTEGMLGEMASSQILSGA